MLLYDVGRNGGEGEWGMKQGIPVLKEPCYETKFKKKIEKKLGLEAELGFEPWHCHNSIFPTMPNTQLPRSILARATKYTKSPCLYFNPQHSASAQTALGWGRCEC